MTPAIPHLSVSHSLDGNFVVIILYFFNITSVENLKGGEINRCAQSTTLNQNPIISPCLVSHPGSSSEAELWVSVVSCFILLSLYLCLSLTLQDCQVVRAATSVFLPAPNTRQGTEKLLCKTVGYLSEKEYLLNYQTNKWTLTLWSDFKTVSVNILNKSLPFSSSLENQIEKILIMKSWLSSYLSPTVQSAQAPASPAER